jgi:hypothetical protein
MEERCQSLALHLLEEYVLPATLHGLMRLWPSSPTVAVIADVNSGTIVADSGTLRLSSRDAPAECLVLESAANVPEPHHLLLTTIEPDVATAERLVAPPYAAKLPRVVMVGAPHPTAPGAALAVLRAAGCTTVELTSDTRHALRAYYHWASGRGSYVTSVLFTDAERTFLEPADPADAAPTPPAFQTFWAEIAAQANVLVVPAALNETEREALAAAMEQAARPLASLRIVLRESAPEEKEPQPMHVVHLQLTQRMAKPPTPLTPRGVINELWYWQTSSLLSVGNGQRLNSAHLLPRHGYVLLDTFLGNADDPDRKKRALVCQYQVFFIVSE